MAKGVLRLIAFQPAFYGQGREGRRLRIGTEFDFVPTKFDKDGAPVLPKWARLANSETRKAAVEAKRLDEQKILEGVKASSGNPNRVNEQALV